MQFRRIRDLREDNDLTQTDLAKELHCSQRTYSYYESGEHNLPIEILIKREFDEKTAEICYNENNHKLKATERRFFYGTNSNFL